MRRPLLQLTRRNFCRDARADNGCDIFRSGATSAFLNAAMDKRSEPRTAIAVEHADAFGSVKTMRRKRQKASTHLLHVDGEPTAAGGSVHENCDAAFPRDFSD